VRRQAIHQLSKQGGEVVSVLAGLLENGGSAEARRNAVWALTRIGETEAREAVRTALHDKDNSIRHAAIHSVGVWRDSGALPQLVESLKTGSPPLQRAAAEALGRIGDPKAIPELLAQSAHDNDRILEHSLTYALIEIADPVATASGLRALSSNTRRAALIALDQMDGGGLKPEMVTPLLASSDPVLKRTASWIMSQHAEWGHALAGVFRRRLSDPNLSASDREELRRQLAGSSRSRPIQELLAETISSPGSKQAQLIALEAMGKAPLKEMPEGWCTALAGFLNRADANLIRASVSVARALPVPEGATPLRRTLLRVGRSGGLPAEVRLDALASVSGGMAEVEPELFDFLIAHVDPSRSVAIRGAAAHVLGSARLTADQLLALTDSLKTVGPLELPRLLSAYEKASDETLGLKLIAALSQSKSLRSLRQDALQSSTANFPASTQKRVEELLVSLDIDPAKQAAHLDQLLATLQGGDVRRGQAVFASTGAACSACHAIGYLGGKLGPDLTKIGEVRTERDLLESIIYPSASFVRSYEPVAVLTTSGDVHNGAVLEDGRDEILLATGPYTEVRIARTEIREVRPSAVSAMPAGLEEVLTRQELADLLAFLRQTKWGAQ
jgi:putative heme-binding domain-containing protein